MKEYIYLSIMLAGSCICAEDAFDLKAYERAQKKYIPWSLTGSAQNLRSDAKNFLQLIFRSFILLRPEATWDDQSAPSENLITDGFTGLEQYLAEPKNADKRAQVEASIAYIADTYIPEVQRALEEEGAAKTAEPAVTLEKKKQLFKDFSDRFSQARIALASATGQKNQDEKAADE